MLPIKQALPDSLIELQKIREELFSVLCENALRMKLDTPDWMLPMSQAHDLSFFRLRSDLKALRQ